MSFDFGVITASIIAAFAAATLACSLIARAGFPLPSSDGRMGCIDGIRGYLALSVLAHHYMIWMQVIQTGGRWAGPTIPAFNQLGAGSVGVFFMITGFVFYRKVLTGFAMTSWPTVYITRVFRIVPLLAVSVAAVTLVAMARSGEGLHHQDVWALAKWLSTRGEPGLAGDPDAGRINAHVLWSLWFEWLFYVFVLPASAALMDLIREPLPSWTVPATLFAIAILGKSYAVRVPLLYYLPLFAAGMVAFEIRARPALVKRLKGRGAACFAAAAMAAAIFAFPLPISPAFPAFLFFFACVACGNPFFGILATKGALVLGEITFSIYLLHGIFLSVFFTEGGAIVKAIPTPLLPFFLPIVSLGVVLVACVTYLAIERPAMSAGRSIAQHWSRLQTRSRGPEIEVAP